MQCLHTSVNQDGTSWERPRSKNIHPLISVIKVASGVRNLYVECRKYLGNRKRIPDVVKANLEGDANEMDFGGKDDEYKSSQSQ